MASYTFASQRDIEDVVTRVKSLVASHVPERVNGYKVVVSTTAPTDNDTSVITIVVPSS